MMMRAMMRMMMMMVMMMMMRQAETKNHLPRAALTLCPTMTNAPEAAPVLTFALPGGTPLSSRPACASTLLRGNFRPGRPPDLWSART